MPTRAQIVRQLHEEQPYLAAEFGVHRMGLFGSHARGEADQASDVDLLVEFDQPLGFRFLELVDHLERVLGRRVDVLTPAGMQSIRVRQVAQDVREGIIYVREDRSSVPRRPQARP